MSSRSANREVAHFVNCNLFVFKVAKSDSKDDALELEKDAETKQVSTIINVSCKLLVPKIFDNV